MAGRFGAAGSTLADQALVSLVNFSSFFLMARALTDAEFGLFAIGFTTILILTSFQQALLGNVYQVKAADREGESLRTFTTIVFSAQAVLSLVLAGLLLAAGAVVWLLGMTSNALLLAGIALSVAPWLTQDLMRKAFYTHGRVGQALLNDMVCYGLQMAGVFWLLLAANRPSVFEALMVYGLASAMASALGYVQLRDLFSPSALRSRRRVRAVIGEVWRFGKWLAGARLWREIGSTGQTWIVAFILGPGPLGAFRAATHLVNVFNPLELAVGLWLPSAASRRFVAGGGGALKAWYVKLVPRLLIPMAVGALLVTAGAEWMIHVAYAGKFDGMGLHWIVSVLAFSRVISFGRDLYHNGLVAANRPDTSLTDSLLAGGLKYGVGVPAVQALGLMGGPVSSVAVSLGTFAYNRWAFLALPDADVRPPLSRVWIPRGSGAEGMVYHDPRPGVATKVYSERASVDSARKYYAALEAAASRPDFDVVATPRPLGFEPEIPLIRMESCSGIPLGMWLSGSGYDPEVARRLARRLWAGMNSVATATGAPTYDLWPSNALYDALTDTLTFVDFAEGSERVVSREGSLGAQTLGGFMGHAFYNQARPRGLVTLRFNRRVVRLCQELWQQVGSAQDKAAVRHVTADIYANCTRSGGSLRGFYYRTLGRLRYASQCGAVFGTSPPSDTPHSGHPTMIYHYFSDFPPDEIRTANGVRKAVRSLAAGLEAIGTRSSILTEGAIRSSWMTAGSVEVHCFRSPSRQLSGLLLPSGLHEFVRAIPREALFVVHGQFSRKAARVAAMLHRMGRPYVLMPHSLYSQEVFDRHPVRKAVYWRLIEKPTLQRAALIQLMENRQADPLRERGIRTPTVSIPNAFDPEQSLELSDLSWNSKGPIELYYLGRINFHQKGLDLLVRAVARVMHDVDLRLTIQGPDGGDLGRLKDIARETGADRITTFLPPDYQSSATELMAGYDAYCMPSRIEGFPIAALEAMQAARPLLFSDVSGLTDAVRESGCGILVRPDLDHLTEGLRLLCARRNEFQAMGLAGRAYLQANYSREAVARQALSAYTRAGSYAGMHTDQTRIPRSPVHPLAHRETRPPVKSHPNGTDTRRETSPQ